MSFTTRLAMPRDSPALHALVEAATRTLQRTFLTPEQIEASRSFMGVDSQLITDGTYYLVHPLDDPGRLAGAGGWSRRATLYGGDESAGRDATRLDPATQPARIRAMFTHPAYARRGIGRLILALCERAARDEGFGSVELVGTLSGQPLYEACGYKILQRLTDARGGTSVPLVHMRKVLTV